MPRWGLQLRAQNQRSGALLGAVDVSPLCHRAGTKTLSLHFKHGRPPGWAQVRAVLLPWDCCRHPTAFPVPLILSEEPCPAGKSSAPRWDGQCPLWVLRTPGLRKSAPKPHWRGDSELCPSSGWARGETEREELQPRGRKRQNSPWEAATADCQGGRSRWRRRGDTSAVMDERWLTPLLPQLFVEQG